MYSTMHWMLPTKDFSAALDDLGIKYDADQQNALQVRLLPVRQFLRLL